MAIPIDISPARIPGVFLIEHRIEDRLLGQAGRKLPEPGSGDQVQLLRTDRTIKRHVFGVWGSISVPGQGRSSRPATQSIHSGLILAVTGQAANRVNAVRHIAQSTEVRYFGTLADCNIARSTLLRYFGQLHHRPQYGTSALWPTESSPEVRYFGTLADCNIARSTVLRHFGQLQDRPKYSAEAHGTTATWGSAESF